MGSTTFVLVHGAFRGGWAWDRLRPVLADRGHATIAPTLTGCESASPRVGTRLHLSEWVDDVVAAIDEAAGSPRVVVVAHSQAGLPVRAALERRWREVAEVVYLDAAVPLDGERGVDLNPPGAPATPPDLPPDLWVPARPVGSEQGFTDDVLASFVNERLVPTPLGPSLDPVRLTEPGAEGLPARFVFFDQTPGTYPCNLTRLRLDAQGRSFLTLDAPHDAPLTHTDEVADLLTLSS